MTWTATVEGIQLYCVNGVEPTLIAVGPAGGDNSNSPPAAYPPPSWPR
jgi:hypothetical protein